MLLHHPLDILDYDDGVVHDDADGEHDGQQRDRVGRIAHRLEHDEGADQADRNRQRRYQRRAQAAEEEKHYDHDENEGLDQCLLDFVNGVGDERGRIIGNSPGKIVGKVVLELAQAGTHRFDRSDRIGARCLIDRHHGGGPAVESRFAVEIGGAQLQLRSVAEPQNGSVGVGAHYNIGEFLDGVEATLSQDVQLQLLIVGYGSRADAADRSLDVLRPNGVDDVAGGEPQAGEPIGPDPGAHGIILRAPQGGIAHAWRALDRIEQVDRNVVGDEQRIMRMVRGVDCYDAKQGRRLLLHRDALALDVLGQAGEGDLDPVIDVDGVDVRIGSELERSGERIAAVVAADALHVDHLVDAHDLGFDGLGDGRVHHAGIGAGIEGGDGDLGWNDIRILRDWNCEQRQEARDRGHDGDDNGKPRSVDKDRRKHRSAPAQRCRQRARAHRRAGPHALETFDDDLFAARQPLADDDVRPALAAELETLHHSLAVLDHERIDALLIGDQGSLGDDHLLFRRAALEADSDQLPVDEAVGGIGKAGAHKHGIRAAIHRNVHEIDLAQLVVDRTIGKAKPNFYAADIDLLTFLLGAQELALAHRERHIHWILADDHGQRPALWTDHIALRDIGSSDLPGNRRHDVGVAEI